MHDWMAADDENEHIANLVKLRDRLIGERRTQVEVTMNSDDGGNVSDAEFIKLRELQARIEEVKSLLQSEKGVAYEIRSAAEYAERAKNLQERNKERFGEMIPY